MEEITDQIRRKEVAKGELRIKKSIEESFLHYWQNGERITLTAFHRPTLKESDIMFCIVKNWNAFEEGGLVEKLLADIEETAGNINHDAVQCVGEWETGLFCGLEDQNITDRYDACRYGYDHALEKVQEWIIDGIVKAIAEAKEGAK